MKVQRWFLFFFLFQLFSFPVLAQELPIEVNADSIDYSRDKGMVTGTGNVVVTYQDTTLIADKGSVNLETKEAQAEGNVQIIQKGQKVIGDALYYNFETGQGWFSNATGFYAPWYACGQKIVRHSKEKYEVQKGAITTCDCPQPHYRLKASKVDIYPGKKLVAKNVLFYIGKVPVFWLPIFVYPLNDRESRWSFIPGYSKRWGGFLLTSYEWLQTEAIESNVRLDYRARRGIGVGVDGEYKLKKSGKGKFKTYYIHDKRREFDDGHVGEEDRYRVSLSHYQPWKFDTTIRGEFHKLSDDKILEDFFYKDSDYSIRPYSFVDITKYHRKYSARLYVQKRINEFYSEVERLPEASLEFRRQRIFKTPFFYTSLNSLGNLSKKFANDETPSQDAQRFDTYDEISYPKKYFGWLETNIYTGIRQTWYSRDLVKSDSLWRGSFSSGAEVGTKIHRLYNYENNRWDIHGLRHVIEPRLKYTYVHDPTVAASRLIQFDQVDALEGQNSIRPSLRNKLQTKRDNMSWDLVDLLFYIDYYFDRDPGQHEFSDFFTDLELRLLRNFSMDMDMSYNIYDSIVSSFNTDIAVYREGKWRVTTGYRYLDEQSSQWTWGIEYTINADWSVKALNRWEFETGDLQEQEYIIHRDLHCWDTAFVFRKTGEEVQAYITFWLKAYPEMAVDLGN